MSHLPVESTLINLLDNSKEFNIFELTFRIEVELKYSR